MSVIDTLTRVDAICQMYDRYDAGRLNGANVAGEDPFARLYASVDAEINQCLEVQTPPLFATQVCPYDPMIRSARSLGSACCRNVEIRRAKAKLLESDLPNLQRLALKKVKGLSEEELATRSDLVSALPDRIQSIPDGSAAPPKRTGLWGASGSSTGTEIKFDSTSG